jgi:hypothetical protein
VIVKSNPVPESAIVWLGMSIAATVKLPEVDSALIGANTTPTVQLAPAASVAAQVLLTRVNPAGAVSVSPFTLSTVPWFVTVSVIGELLCPTPVVGKLIEPGDT